MRNFQRFGYILAVVIFWQPFSENLVSAGFRQKWREMTSFDIEFERVDDYSYYEPIVGGYPVFGKVTHRVVFYERSDHGMHIRIKTRHKYHFLIVRSKLDEKKYQFLFFKIEHQISHTSSGISIFRDAQSYKNPENAMSACLKVLEELAITTRSGWSLVQDVLNLKWVQIAVFKKVGLLVLLHFLFILIPFLVCIPIEHILLYGALAMKVVFGTAFTVQTIGRRLQRNAAKGRLSQTQMMIHGFNFTDLLEDERDEPLALYEQLLAANAGKFASAKCKNVRRYFSS